MVFFLNMLIRSSVWSILHLWIAPSPEDVNERKRPVPVCDHISKPRFPEIEWISLTHNVIWSGAWWNVGDIGKKMLHRGFGLWGKPWQSGKPMMDCANFQKRLWSSKGLGGKPGCPEAALFQNLVNNLLFDFHWCVALKTPLLQEGKSCLRSCGFFFLPYL